MIIRNLLAESVTNPRSDLKFGNTWCAERFSSAPAAAPSLADIIATIPSYANSVLQALYFCNPFRELLLQLPGPPVPSEPPIAQAPQTSQLPPHATTVRRRPERKFSATDSRAMPDPGWNNTPLPSGPLIPSTSRTLSSALRSLFAHISKHPGVKGTVAPRAFIEKLKELNELFRSSMHQDAHEFLNFLLNRIVEETEEERKRMAESDRELDRSPFPAPNATLWLNTCSSVSNSLVSLPASTGSGSSSPTIVHKLFEGVLTSETRCLTCETVSSRDESFLDLSIDIEQNSSVTACLRQFSASEMLCQKNKFFCDGCCDLQEAEKRMKIKKLPNVLALHLKRFKYQEDVQKYIKLTYRVAFPMELRLFNTVDDTDDPDRLYELYAIVVHIGKCVISLRFRLTFRLMRLLSGPHHGHYVSIIKAGGVWKLFDDDSVESINESDIPKYFGDSNCGSAYVLYYQAVDINLPSLGLRPSTPPPTTSPAPVPAPASVPSDDSQAPALPPGLTTEHDSSDLAESSGPTTPAPSNPTYSPKINSSPTHSKPNLPPHDFPPPPPIPQQPPHKSQGGLFHSLRHVPSVKIKGHGSERKPLLEAVSVSTNSSASGSTPSPANASSPQLHNKSEVSPAIPVNTSADPTSPKSNGIGKDKWYRRKTTKNKEKDGTATPLKVPPINKRPNTAPGKRPESLAPPSPASTADSISQRSSSPSHPQSESEGRGEKPAIPPALMRKSSAPVPRHSPTSSRSTPSFADDIPAVPPLPPIASSPTFQTYRMPRPLPQAPSLPFDMPQRRATVVAGEADGRTEFNGHAKLNGDITDQDSKLRPNSLHADMLMTTSSSSSDQLTPTPAAPGEASAPLLGTDSSTSGIATTTATGQGTIGAGSNWRKATRKLSLSTTMLGFAKKEKHRDKLGGIPSGPS